MNTNTLKDQFDRSVEVVLGDLRATGGPMPARIGDIYEDPGFTVSRHFTAADGYGRGIRMPIHGDHADRLAFLADEIQEWVIEARWKEGSNWPQCPHHPDNHPMEAAVVDGRATWRCPVSKTPVAEIGALSRSK